jgi:hypothetical protein
MMQHLGRRLARLERSTRISWAPWQGRPLDEWPDEAIALFLCSVNGLQVASGSAAVAYWTDDRLAATMAEAGS